MPRVADAWTIVSGSGALVAAVFAGAAWWEAHQSAGAAKTSAEAADATVNLQRAEVGRALERVDVQWTVNLRDSREAGELVLTNAGSTTACEVEVVAAVNADRLHGESARVDPGGSVTIDVADAAAKSVEAFRRRMDANRGSGMALLGPPRWKVSIRITWVSELGTPGVQVIG